MDYEKKYKEALEKLQKALAPDDGCEISGLTRACIEEIFPELKQDEDERIRKALIKLFETENYSGFVTLDGIDIEDVLAWLEKQSEAHKEALSEEEEGIRKAIINYFQCQSRDEPGRKKIHDKWIAWLEKQEKLKSSNWTEGDVVRHGGILALVTNGRKAMKSNFELITIQYPDEWVKAETKERKYFFEELKKQGEQKQISTDDFDVVPGLYKCVHRMFDCTCDGKLLFEIGEVYKCLTKHDRAEFEVSYGHSVYLEDPVVRKHFIPIKEQKPAWSEEDEKNLQKAIWYIENPAPNVIKSIMLSEWLKSLRQRIGD